MTFAGITHTAFDGAVVPALEELGRVQKLSVSESATIVNNDRELKNSKAAAAAAVGDVSGTKSLVTRALDMAGEGGRASKKRRMAQMVVRTLDLSQRVAASGLREAKEVPESDSE